MEPQAASTSKGRSGSIRVRRAAPYLAAFGIGVLSSIQSRMNGGLAVLWDNPRQAAVYSFGTGLIALTLIMLASPPVRRGLTTIWRSLRGGELRWWEFIGGFLGGMFVLAQSSIVPLVGVAAFTVGVVAGQTANSLLVDRLGVGPRGRIAVSGARLVAAGLAVLAVVVAVGADLPRAGVTSVLPIVAAFGVGVLIAFQQAINGRVTVVSGQPLSATWLNFALGTLLLAVVFVISLLAGGAMSPIGGGHPLLYLGGLVGLVFIAFAAWAVTKIGVLVTSLLAISGQLTSAVALDIWLPTASSHLTVGLVVGVVMAFVAVLIGTRRTVGG